MKTVNNKIKKPFVSIGFDATGKLTYNVDLNKLNKLNDDNGKDLEHIIANIKHTINGTSIENRKPVQALKIVNDFCLMNNSKFDHRITLDDMIEVEVFIRNNKKLGAVKKFKEISGCGLKEGKDFVEFYAEKNKRQI